MLMSCSDDDTMFNNHDTPAVENCPNMKIAYVPEDTEIADNAFAGVHPDFQIIRGDFTNIPSVKED